MSNQASITLTSSSLQKRISLSEVKDLLHYYKDITEKTGNQLNWQYSEAAFPYVIMENSSKPNHMICLKGDGNKLYNYLLLGVETALSNEETDDFSTIHIGLTEISTHGDKAKANEMGKFLASKLKGKLTLFNGRVMHYDLKK
ncbi:DUF1885 family protein [Fictibacillus iocasae]|uniref:DUF1885 family protein n=1 Tax=Fictibacillus iocasae TaxID=2715437 RepID=A0ABW2NTQ5_9BACL